MFSGVGDPFLNHEHRYHCPVFGILKFTKPKKKSFTRHIYNYNNGNFDLLRDKASSFDLDTLQGENKDIYASNIGAPQGFWGSGEKGYLFSGSWGPLLIILGELGSKHILFGI